MNLLDISDKIVFNTLKNLKFGYLEITKYNGELLCFGNPKDQLKANGYDVFFAPNSTSVIKVPIPQSLQRGSLNHLRLVLAR